MQDLRLYYGLCHANSKTQHILAQADATSMAFHCSQNLKRQSVLLPLDPALLFMTVIEQRTAYPPFVSLQLHNVDFTRYFAYVFPSPTAAPANIDRLSTRGNNPKPVRVHANS